MDKKDNIPIHNPKMSCGVTGLPLLATPFVLAIIFYLILRFTYGSGAESKVIQAAQFLTKSGGVPTWHQVLVMLIFAIVLLGMQIGLSAAFFQWEASRENRKIKNMGGGLGAVTGFTLSMIIFNFITFFVFKRFLPSLKSIPVIGWIVEMIATWFTGSIHSYWILAWGLGLSTIILIIPIIGWILSPILLLIPGTPLFSYIGYVVGCKSLGLEPIPYP